MASGRYSRRSGTNSTPVTPRSISAPRVSEHSEESEPYEDSDTQTPIAPSFHMPYTAGPRTRQTARKQVGRLPPGQLARRDAESIGSMSHRIERPPSPVPIDPAKNARRRALIDREVHGQMWSTIRSHHDQLHHLRQFEHETYSAVQAADDLMERHDREIVQLQAELKALKEKKGFLASAWDWLRGKH
jgi:hypothetical protein